MEHIPSFILDLLQLKTFEQLSAAEQKEVIKHISREEYISLYSAAAASRSFLQQKHGLAINPLRKEELMSRLQQKRQQVSPLRLILNKPVEMWKVAAILLLLGFGGTLLMMQVKKGASQVKYITELDTVYMEKEMPVTKVYDTIYLTREVDRSSRSAKHSNEVGHQYTSTDGLPQQLPPDEYSGINMISIQERDRPLNNKKGSSIKDDSLINSYGFTRL